MKVSHFSLSAAAFAALLFGGCEPERTAQPKPDAAAQSAAKETPDGGSAAAPPDSATNGATTDNSLASNTTGRPIEPAKPDADPAADAPAQGAAWMKTPVIDRKLLFSNPDKAAARVSPDGKHLAFLAPVDGVLNIWVGPADNLDEAKPVTKDKYRGIHAYSWAYNNTYLLYTQDVGGDEDFHVYAVDVAQGSIQDLTPLKKVRAEIEGVSEKFPDELLIGLNDRDPRYHDIYRVNIATGERKLIQQNPDFAGFVTDDDFRVRFASKMMPDGGTQYYQPDGDGGWKDFMKIDMEDSVTTGLAGFDKTGDILYLLDSRGRDTAAFKSIDLKTGDEKLIAENDKADIGGVLAHPTEKTIEAVSFNYLRTEWQVLDPAIQADLDYLKTVADGEVLVTSRTLDDTRWTVAFLLDDGPASTYLYDRKDGNRKTKFLFTNRKALEGLPLVKMHPLVIKARDGLNLVSYLTLPPESDTDNDGVPHEPLPLVLDVHGGPWARMPGALTAALSFWPTAAMPCCRSITAARPASARISSMPARRNGPARCTTT